MMMKHLDGGVLKLKLGAWLKIQRYQRGTLDDTKEKLLESVGVNWRNCKLQNITKVHFDRNFDLLLGFQEREGHVRLRIEHQESATDNLGA